MTALESIFDEELGFDPGGDFAAFLKGAPAKWAVYLMADAEGRPVQLLCVKNLRYSLQRRLGTQTEEPRSKRVDYRELVRRVYWRRVDSALEADWIYLEAARRIFPQTYRGMVGYRPAWFVHVDAEAAFPRYTKTIDIADKRGLVIGPVEDKHAAARLIALAEDAFDLCRYYNILLEAPRGKACAYKEMGKCPAPCDGSIGMEQYRRMIEWSAATIVEPGEMLREQKQRMAGAAGELRFEAAAKIKAFVDQLGQLGKGDFRHVRRLEDFAYVAVQKGSRKHLAKVFVVTAGEIEHIADLLEEPKVAAELLQTIGRRAERGKGRPLEEAGIERIGVVANHLFSAKTRGVILPLAQVDEKALAKAYREIVRQKAAEEVEGEGVMKELQAM